MTVELKVVILIVSCWLIMKNVVCR